MSKDELRKQLLEICPPIFGRDQVERITGGLINRRTLANLDSSGEGPSGKVGMGKIRVGYLREPFVDWFVNRLNFQG